MKKGLIVGLAVASVAAAVSSLVTVGVSAGPLGESGAYAAADDRAAGTIPAHRIAAGVRAAGLDPEGAPKLRGRYYVLRAFDPYGTEMRIVADAEFGDIVSIVPARQHSGGYRQSYRGGARIIHVPQPDDAVAAGDYRDKIDGDDAGRVDDAADPEPPKQNRRPRPAKRQRSAAPPPIKRNIVTSAPPPPPQAADKDKEEKDKALTPIYPTPDFGANAGSGEKFEPQPRQN